MKKEVKDLELGNIMFNNNMNQEYECPRYIIALLRDIDKVLERVIHNTQHIEYNSPFENTAESFRLPKVFEVHAYNWNDDESQEYNFIYYVDKFKANMDDLKISWYKYLGRDTTINQELDPNTVINIYNDIIKELNEYEDRWFREHNIYF